MKVTEYDIGSPVSIALLSDIHNRRYDKIIEIVKKLKPDIIAVPGDIVVGRIPSSEGLVLDQDYRALPFLRECASIAPTFFSYGNHEYLLSAEEIDMIRKTSVTVLDDSYVMYNGLCIGGLTSGRRHQYTNYKDYIDIHTELCDDETSKSLYPNWGYYNNYIDTLFKETPNSINISDLYERMNQPHTDWLDKFEKEKGYKVLLSHHPEYWDTYLKKRDIDLILSGHAHGGQWRFFNHGVLAPGQGLFPRYTKGIHVHNSNHLCISTGLANTARPIPRFFNPREIVYIK